MSEHLGSSGQSRWPGEPRENIHGSRDRLDRTRSHLQEEASVLEFGCAIGCMIRPPLALDGMDMEGVDFDDCRIECWPTVLDGSDLDPSIPSTQELSALGPSYDIVIAYEVGEHIETTDPVTVPTGCGWIETVAASDSAMLCGPTKNKATRGLRPFLRPNCRLGGSVPPVASGFHLIARVGREPA